MALDREPIFEALAERLATAAGFTTPCSRRFRHWDDVAPEEQPAMFLVTGQSTARSDPGHPTVWSLTPKVLLYFRHDADPEAIPGTQMHALIQAVEKVLEKTPEEGAAALLGYMDEEENPTTTLGGLVASCRIQGTVETDEGLFQAQGVAEIPLELIATA